MPKITGFSLSVTVLRHNSLRLRHSAYFSRSFHNGRCYSDITEASRHRVAHLYSYSPLVHRRTVSTGRFSTILVALTTNGHS